MKPVPFLQLVFFLLLLMVIIFAAVSGAGFVGDLLTGVEIKSIFVFFTFAVLYFIVGVVIYRLVFLFFPIKFNVDLTLQNHGFQKNIYVMFYFFVFFPYTRNSALFLFLSKWIAQTLGAQIGFGSQFSAIIHDHFAVSIGRNTVCGESSVIYAHVVEGEKFILIPVTIGSNVTIGANSVIMPGAIIEDGAIVAAGAVVTKNQHIGRNEIWGGVPARKIR